MKYRWDKKYLYWGITGFLVIVASILFFLLLNRFDIVAGWIGVIGGILVPFAVAFILAYLLSPIVNFFERRCFLPLWNRWKRRRSPAEAKPGADPQPTDRLRKPPALPRALAIAVTFLLAIAVVAGLIGMILPQIVDSLSGLIGNLSSYVTVLQTWTTDLVHDNEDLALFLNGMFANIQTTITDWTTDWSKNILPQITTILSGVTTGLRGLVSFLTNTFIGIVVAIYLLFSREKFIAQAKKMCYAIFGVKPSNRILRVTRRADRVFGSFIKGKLIDSLIIGCLFFFVMSVFNLIFPHYALPYVLLISVILGLFNIIPFFGPIIGAVPCALLVLVSDITNPLKCVFFIIIVLVIQQFDGNILGPRILGESTGLSAFWVTFAILAFGGVFGFAGLVLGVPTFALIYSFLAEFSYNRLEKQSLPTGTGAYDNLDHIEQDEDGSEAVYLPEEEPKPRKPKRQWKLPARPRKK